MTKELYSRMLARSSRGTLVIMTMIVCYLLMLMPISGPQGKKILLVLATLAPLFFGAFTIQFRSAMKPIVDVLEGVKTGEKALAAAERRCLSLPFRLTIMASFWFTSAGVTFALVLMKYGGFTVEQGIYIIGSAATGGIATGMTGNIYAKEPLDTVMLWIWKQRGGTAERPSFFIPLIAKQVGAFTLTLILVVTFLSLLTATQIKRILAAQREASQKEQLVVASKTFAEHGDRSEMLRLFSGGGEIEGYCIADISGQSIECASGINPSKETVASLVAASDYAALADASGAIWMRTATTDGASLVISRAAPIGGLFMDPTWKRFYLKVAAVVLFVGVLLGLLLAMDVARPLMKISATASDITQGRIVANHSAGTEDETGILARSFSRMTAELLSQLDRNKSMLDSIGQAVKTFAPMSRDLVSIAGRQTTSSADQASSSEQAATTSEEIKAVSRQIADFATQVTDFSDKAAKLAAEGREDLVKTTEKVNDIQSKMSDIAKSVLALGESSQKIGAIVELIEEIGRQTNLLALNASIESAAAGEYGGRFMVVAKEIRRLSEDTAQSTKQIAGLIVEMRNSVTQSIMMAEEGEKSVAAGRVIIENLAEIQRQIFELNSNIAPRLKEIDLMTGQQASASEQMSQVITGVKDIAMQNSVSATQIQSSVENLEKIVAQLEAHLESKNQQPNRSEN